MKIKHYLSAFVLVSLLSGCSDPNNNAECGINPNNSNLVDGYSNSVCAEHKESQALTAVSKGFGISTLPNGSEAKERIEEHFEKDVSASQLRDETNEVMSIVKSNYNSLFYLYAFILVVASIPVHIISLMTQQDDFLNPGKKRYSLFANGFLILIGAIALLPYEFEGATKEENSTFADYLTSLKIRWGNMFEAEVAGNVTASTQVGDKQSGSLSDSSKKYSETFFKAKSIAFSEVESKLTDNRTSKLFFELHNLTNPAEKRKIEFTTKPMVFPTSNGYVVKRMPEEELREDRAIAVLYTVEHMTDSALDGNYRKISQSISSKYNADSSFQFNSQLESFKAELIQKMELESSNKKVNSAVSVQASKMIGNLLVTPSDEKYELISSITRLVEEYECSEIPESLDVKKRAQNYIKFVSGEKPNDDGSSIACVGEDKSSYYTYGTRTRADVKTELFDKFKKLVDLVSIDTEANESSIVMNTVDESNSKYCIAARKEQGIGFALNYPRCLMDSQQNKEIIQTASSNYKMISEGALHYIDTNYDLRNNNLSSDLLNTDYTEIMTDLFNSVETKYVFNNVDKQEYINTLIAGNLGDDDLMTRSISMFLNPANHFDKTLGLGPECEAKFYNCINPGNAYVSIYQLSQNMFQLGSYIAFGGIITGMADSKAGKMKDKSSNFEFAGKKKSKYLSIVSGAATVVKNIIDFFQPFAVPLMASAIMLLLVMVMPTFMFIGGAVSIFLQVILTYIIGPAYYIWMFWANDRNNISLNLRKMAGEIFYTVTIKSVFILLQAAYYFFFGIILFMEAYAMSIVASADLQSAIVWSICFVPILYLTILNCNQLFIDILNAYIKATAGTVEMTETMTIFIEKFQSIVSFGLPLTYLILRKKKK